MKLASFVRDGHARFGAVLHGERVMDLKGAAAGAEPAQLAALEHAVSFLEAGPELMDLAREIQGGVRDAFGVELVTEPVIVA